MELFKEKDFARDIKDYSLAPQGFRAKTYWNEMFVLQKRDIIDWPRWETVVQILDEAGDENNLLIGLKHHYYLEEDAFWLRFARHDLEGSPSRKRNLDWNERVDFFSKALADYFLLDNFLQNIKIDEELAGRLISFPPQKTEAVGRYGEREIIAAAEIFSFFPPVPYPKSIGYSYQHADMSLSNTILSEYGYRLIDWESFAFRERGSDLVHVLCFVLLPTPFEEWPLVISLFEEEIAKHLNIDISLLRQRIYWEMLREFIFWQKGEDLYEKAKKTLFALGL